MSWDIGQSLLSRDLTMRGYQYHGYVRQPTEIFDVSCRSTSDLGHGYEYRSHLFFMICNEGARLAPTYRSRSLCLQTSAKLNSNPLLLLFPMLPQGSLPDPPYP